MRRILFDFLQLSQVVVADQWFVLVQLLQGLFRLGRIRVNNFVPDKILLLLRRKMSDIIIDEHELRQRRHVKACSGLVKSPDDRWFGVGFDSVIRLNFRQMLFERPVILPKRIVIDHHDRRPVFPGNNFELLGCHASMFCMLAAGFKLFPSREQAKSSGGALSSSSLRGPDSSPSRRTGALRSALATSSHQYRECDFPEAQRDTMHRNPALLWAFRPKI